MQGRSETSQHPLRHEQYLTRSDSNLHLLFVLRDILTFLVNCCGITDYWETSIFEKSWLPSNHFSVSAEQAIFWLQLSSQGLCLHCWKVSVHCIVYELKHTKNLHVALSALRCVIIFLVLQKGGRNVTRIYQGYELSAPRGWKNLKMLCCSPRFVSFEPSAWIFKIEKSIYSL